MQLKKLDLDGTQVTDDGCATLVAALDSGALPALEVLELEGIVASDAAKAAAYEALSRSIFFAPPPATRRKPTSE